MKSKMMLLLFVSLTCFIIFPLSAKAQITVDGNLDESEWSGARSFTDFIVIDPLTLDTPRLPTEVRILSVEDGLAVGFICSQPADSPRTRTVTQRDATRFDSDSVGVMIDFDGTNQVAYEFSVSIAGSFRDGTITNESDFNYDWDGVWEHAVHETEDEWTVEILLPWSIVAMREGKGDTRQLGIFFQRVFQGNKETFGFPAASPERPQFISNFTRIDVAQFSEMEFNIWPYATMLSDLVNDTTKGKAGVDVFWKPSGNFQLAATINPDFGQVESDDLVIDFSAIEVRFNDKRPFFTENQAMLDLRMPNRGFLIYTRRIGGASDKDGTPSDIDGAVKAIGSAGSVDYGVLMAQEANEEGRTFLGGRLFYPAKTWSLGTVTTYTDRPFLDRTALVNSLDYEIEPGNLWRVQGQFLTSNIDEPSEDISDFGAWYRFYYTPDDAWHLQMDMSHWGEDLDISDMGYIMRTNLEELFLFGSWRQTEFSGNSSAASIDWTLWSILRQNAEGTKLQSKVVFQRQEKLKSGSSIDFMLSLSAPGYDDLISRGNGLVWYDEKWSTSISYSAQRRGSWRKSIALEVMQEGYDGWGAQLDANATWYPNDKLNVDFGLIPRWSDDWLIWLEEDQLASYSLDQITGEISPSWFPAPKHEIRLKTQWIVIKAETPQVYRIGPDSRLMAVDEAVDDFAMLNFGLQLRYRYEIAPLSDFHIVYSRGGIERVENSDDSILGLLGPSTELRDSDQILAKLRYRF